MSSSTKDATSAGGSDGEISASLGKLDEYELIEKLGAGGVGVVYKARHVHLQRTVALKVVHASHEHPAAVTRVRREMAALGRLNHPHFVQAFDAHEADGAFLLAMEYVKGPSAAQLLRQAGPLSVPDACELARQTAEGLHHAGEQGLVHRDIKPANLIVTREGLVKILDLGLALLTTDEELTAPNDPVGTADYTAPEQILNGHAVDARADLYSLGCTLYRLLAGQAPFGSSDFSTSCEKRTAHAFRPPQSIRELRSDVPEELAAILDRLLAKEPADRFANGAEVAAALAPFACGSDLRWLAGTVADCLHDRKGEPATPSGRACATARPAVRWQTGRRLVRAMPWAAAVILAAIAAVLIDRQWHSREEAASSPSKESPSATVPAMTAQWATTIRFDLNSENRGGYQGTIGHVDDMDFLCFQGRCDGTVQIILEPRTRLAIESRLFDGQRDEDGDGRPDEVARCSSSDSGDSCQMQYALQGGGLYFLSSHAKEHASQGRYTVRVRPADPITP